jgi:hypothetical protein
MYWIIVVFIIHIVSSFLAKDLINDAFDYMKASGDKLILSVDEDVNARLLNWGKKYIPHLPLINIYFAYRRIDFLIKVNLKNKRK